MPAPEKPRLRTTITGQLDPENGKFVFLYDSARVSRQLMRVRRELVAILELFTGENTILDMQLALMRLNGGRLFPSQILSDLAEKLDEALFLEGPRLKERFADFLRSPIREPACVGSYEAEPTALRRQLQGLFTHGEGPGLPERNGYASPPHTMGGLGGVARTLTVTATNAHDSMNGPGISAALIDPPHPPLSRGGEGKRLRGALIPHIDFHRGGLTFAWGFKEIVERADADVFVIIGTAHYSGRRFTLTHKSFRTPLGVAPTDEDYVKRIGGYYGDQAFEDELAHLPEHSIEFQVLMLQYCLIHRPFRIVPLLVGSFQDCIASATPPHEQADIYLMIQALRRAEEESGAKVCYISSGDLAHIGPKFGDPEPVDHLLLGHSRRQDHELLKQAEAGDRAGFFDVLLREEDQRRICGFPPTYTLLSVLEPDGGRLLHYDQYVEPRGLESVSFASVGFYK